MNHEELVHWTLVPSLNVTFGVTGYWGFPHLGFSESLFCQVNVAHLPNLLNWPWPMKESTNLMGGLLELGLYTIRQINHICLFERNSENPNCSCTGCFYCFVRVRNTNDLCPLTKMATTLFVRLTVISLERDQTPCMFAFYFLKLLSFFRHDFDGNASQHTLISLWIW